MNTNTYNQVVAAVVLHGNHNKCNQSMQDVELAEEIIRNALVIFL